LPKPQSGALQSRYIGPYLLYGAGTGWGRAQRTLNSQVYAVRYADGTGAGVVRMRFSDDGAHWSGWEYPKTSKSWTLPLPNGYHTVRVQYLDGANNYSAVYSDYIKLQPPN